MNNLLKIFKVSLSSIFLSLASLYILSWVYGFILVTSHLPLLPECVIGNNSDIYKFPKCESIFSFSLQLFMMIIFIVFVLSFIVYWRFFSKLIK